METLTGRTVTKQLKIETRQHELMGLDLGEGPRRRDLLLALVVIPVWVAFVWLILGPPNKYTSLLYMAPPMLFLVYGIQEHSRNPRRMNITQWTLALRHGISGHKPLIRGGVRRPSRGEYLPAGDRWPLGRMASAAGARHLTNRDGSLDWDEVAQVPGLGWTRRHARTATTAQPPITISPKAYLYSTDALVDVADSVAARQARRGRKRK